jgi:hypothetical protein
MVKLPVIAGLVVVVLATSSAEAQRRRQRERPLPQGQFEIEQVAITAGRLRITGRTARPNQVIELTNSGDKTASLPNRRFSFSLPYLPEACKVDLKVEADEIKDLLVTGCMPRGGAGPSGVSGKDGRDGRNGVDGKDGKDGKDGIVYGSLPGDGAAFRCWMSDIIGLWFIKDYPAPNSRTVVHIAPTRVAGGHRLNVTEPQDPLKIEMPDGPWPTVMRSAEFDKDKLYIVNLETKERTGLRGEIAPDCKSISWKIEGDVPVRTWER